MGKPKITIGLPVYNGEKYIESSLTSLLSQSFEDFELIISDNNSTDQTEKICRDICNTDNRVRYGRLGTNLGAAVNFKRVFDLSSGEYFMWAASDDLWSHNYLASLSTALDNSSAILAFASLTSIDPEDTPIREYPMILNLSNIESTALRLNNFLWSPESEGKANLIYGLFRRNMLGEIISNHGMSPQYGYGTWGLDNLFLFRCASIGDFISAPEARFYKRVLPTSIYDSLDSREHLHEIQGYFQGYRAIIESSQLSSEVKDFLIASVAVKEATWYQREFQCGSPDDVRELISEYIHTSPELHDGAPMKPANAIDMATQLFANNETAAAEKIIREHLAIQPHDSQAKLLLSKILRTQGRIIDAQIALEEAFASDTTNLHAGKELAVYYRDAAMSGAYAQKVRELLNIAPYDSYVKRMADTLSQALESCHNRKIAFMNLFCKEGDLVFDVGANVGDKAELFLELGGRVVCVEPQPNCALTLRNRFSANSRVTIEQVGLASSAGEMTLHVCSSANTITTFSEEWKHGRFSDYTWDTEITVEVVTLDHLINKYGTPQYCKIDVEGFEYQVIQGLSELIPYLSFEFAIEMFDKIQLCLNYLNKLGYRKFNIGIGETPALHFNQWISAEEMLEFLQISQDTMLWGDIYAYSPVNNQVKPDRQNNFGNNLITSAHKHDEGFCHSSAQIFEANFSLEWLKDNFENIYSKLKESLDCYRQSGELRFDNKQMLYEFFQNDIFVWNQFVNKVKNKKGLEIGSGPCGAACAMHFISDWHVIDPLISEYKKMSLDMFGKTWWWNCLNLYPQNSEILLKNLVGKIDGVIICRNALDHTEIPIQVLDNISKYAAPGCKLLLWSDLYHLHGHDEGHRNICNSRELFKQWIIDRGFLIDYETPPFRNGETIEFGCVATKTEGQL